MKASDNEFPSVLFEDQSSTPTTPASGFSRIYTKSDGLYVVDDAGGVTGPFGTGGAGSSYSGHVVLWTPAIKGLSAITTFSIADQAYIYPVSLPGPMLLRGMTVDASASATGSIQFQLVDAKTTPTAATEVAAGSAATGGTGERLLAATSAPVAVDAGDYFLIFKLPASNVPTLRRSATNAINTRTVKTQASYTWDTTPDVTSGWSDTAAVPHVSLVGDIKSGGVQW